MVCEDHRHNAVANNRPQRTQRVWEEAYCWNANKTSLATSSLLPTLTHIALCTADLRGDCDAKVEFALGVLGG